MGKDATTPLDLALESLRLEGAIFFRAEPTTFPNRVMRLSALGHGRSVSLTERRST